MLKTRVIPSLLIKNEGLIKTQKFGASKYVGDPINAIKIFNDKEVDELVILDISASQNNKINFDLLARFSKEAFMPLGYGGGIKSAADAQKIISLGFEKVILNTSVIENSNLVNEIASVCGSQSTVVCIDVKKNLLGKSYVYNHLYKKLTNLSPVEYAEKLEKLGAGEIIVYSVDNDGTYKGYSLNIIKEISEHISVPIVALGGAGCIDDFKKAVNAGASAVGAGSLFVFQGPHKAVLITYPEKKTLEELFN